jgi:hypothetical protein
MQTTEGLALTVVATGVNLPTMQLNRLEPLPETELETPAEAYVPPVYEPKQDRH